MNNMQRTSAVDIFAFLSKCDLFTPSLSESASDFLVLTTCFFGGMMANFDINVYMIARNKCSVQCPAYNVGRASYGVVLWPAVYRPMLSYTDAGLRPYDMWPRKRKFLKSVRCPGDYRIRRWFANRCNRTV